MKIIKKILLLLLIVFVIAQFTLPVSSWSDRKKANKHLWLFLLGLHGPAIFIKGGEQIAREEETKNGKSKNQN